jgi:hypothetical protein
MPRRWSLKSGGAPRRGTPEGAVVRSCIEYLRMVGVFAWRNNTGRANLIGAGGKPRPVLFGYPGSGDIFGVLRGGVFLCVECKRPLGPKGGTGGSEQTPDQVEFQRRLEDAGGVYLLVRSASELREALRSRGYGL